ncbi:MAG: hypothetical protein DIU79_14280 [Actinobacteria bacterium]|nr:MAG: hypothetical protein DIU79_14280 [Actinomycetota bacterium]
MTQSDLVRAVGLDRTMIAKVESGTRRHAAPSRASGSAVGEPAARVVCGAADAG